jgi:hypothetical protein
MNRFASMSCLVTALSINVVALAAPATSQTASLGLTSTKSAGTVSVQTDPVLSNGRLVMKVAAHNSSDKPAELASTAVQVFIGADKPVAVLTLDQLIAEARGGPSAERSMNSAHQSSNYSRPTTTTTASGEMDVSGITGGNDAVGRAMSERSSVPTAKKDPATEAYVEALRAGILQATQVAPGKASGAQVVTEKLKFPRKDPRVMRVAVAFNGESHEFVFEAPPAK